MPKNPILERNTFFSRIIGSVPNSGSGENVKCMLRRFDWNVVTVKDVGLCVEPVQDPGPDASAAGCIQVDLNDTAVNNVIVLESDGVFYQQYGTGGTQTTYDVNLLP